MRLLLLPVILLLSSYAHSGEQTLLLREHLNQDWKNQLVSFRIEAADGECHRGAAWGQTWVRPEWR